MRRCRGRKSDGTRCKKYAIAKSNYCNIHSDQASHDSKAALGAITVGLAGLLVGGPVVGAVSALVGAFIGSEIKEEKMAKTKVFISFDYDNDSDLKTLLAGQAKNSDSPFDIEDWSVKQHLTGDWKEKVKSKMKRVDQVAVICGEKTHTATGVSAEINLAKEVGVPYFLIKGRASKTCTKPKAATSGDKLYRWTWDNLKALVGGGR